ncbi:MAG TPA: potassium channel family protein [Solirubrobacteraceae bacterium]|nr:potassium channel family protein [Solirubrobacteraceae bacterium]
MSASSHPGLGSLRRHHGRADEPDVAQYRYGVVFILILITVVFLIVAPEGDASRAIGFAIAGAALLVAIVTSRERNVVRRRRVVGATVTIVVVTVLTAAGAIPRAATQGISVVMTLAVPLTLGGGLLRLVRERGATPQAVAGGLAIYLLLGLLFASVIGFVAGLGSAHFFAQTAQDTTSQRVYYSFTVLTTTGFGDFTAAHGVGRAIAVIEMLFGQIYLVTVISILIGRRIEQAKS